jgi:hypothetical protein
MKKLFGLALVLALCTLLGPARPAHASACTDICLSEDNSGRIDCRFNPYPGCTTDCRNEYDACVAAC